jgi:hypothetical protein
MSQLTIPPEAQEGDEYTDQSNGCVWLVESTSLGGGELTEVSIRCVGTADNPSCRVGETRTVWP